MAWKAWRSSKPASSPPRLENGPNSQNSNMKKLFLTTALAVMATNFAFAQAAPKPKEIVIDGVAGFQDTPMEPDGRWHVHDPARPQPVIVTPGVFSQMAPPPSDAIVLFDGKDLLQWRDKKTGGPVGWTVEDGVAVSAKGDIVTTNEFGDLQLH